jgi:hypothetical protein
MFGCGRDLTRPDTDFPLAPGATVVGNREIPLVTSSGRYLVVLADPSMSAAELTAVERAETTVAGCELKGNGDSPIVRGESSAGDYVTFGPARMRPHLLPVVREMVESSRGPSARKIVVEIIAPGYE